MRFDSYASERLLPRREGRAARRTLRIVVGSFNAADACAATLSRTRSAAFTASNSRPITLTPDAARAHSRAPRSRDTLLEVQDFSRNAHGSPRNKRSISPQPYLGTVPAGRLRNPSLWSTELKSRLGPTVDGVDGVELNSSFTLPLATSLFLQPHLSLLEGLTSDLKA